MSTPTPNSSPIMYESSKATAIIAEINAKLEELKNLYPEMMGHWENAKSNLSLNQSIMTKLDNIGDNAEGNMSLSKTEFDKLINSFETLVTSVTNINTSWSNVATAIDTAIDNYGKTSNPGGHTVE